MINGTMSIAPDAWQRCGTDRRKLNRLLTAVEINGLSMHLEAWRVRLDRDGCQVACEDDDNFDAVHRGVAADGAFTTVSMFGGRYVLIASPFCD